jgi:hypothetical protein
MKTLFGMTAAVLLVVTMLFVALPGTGVAAAGKVTLAEMVKIKKAADEAAQAAKAQAEKAKTDEEKRLAKELVKQAEINAEVAGDLLEAVKAGEDVDREQAEACEKIAKAVMKAVKSLAAGAFRNVKKRLEEIEESEKKLPTAENARDEMQGADGADKNQSLTAEDMNKKELGSSLPTAGNARADNKKKEDEDRVKRSCPNPYCKGICDNCRLASPSSVWDICSKKCKECWESFTDSLSKVFLSPYCPAILK